MFKKSPKRKTKKISLEKKQPSKRLPFRRKIKDKKFPLFFELIKWKIIDIRRAKRNGKKIHLFGIIGIVGLYGGGKTMSLVEYLDQMRIKYGDQIYISTNFFYSGQDFSLNHWKDLLKVYDKPIIFGYDELQNEFNSREYKSFPVSLMTLLTQNRKGNGKQIIYTTQDYGTVDKNFRRLTQHIIACKTRWGRLTSCKYYDREDFENLMNVSSVNLKMKIKPYKRHIFVQTDNLRDSYDSYAMLESAKSKQYMDRDTLERIGGASA